MNYEDACALYKKNHSSPSTTFPYGEEYKNDVFVEQEVPIELLRCWGVEDLYSELMKEVEMDPIWIKACKKKNNTLHPYWDHKFSVVDGNHRVASALQLERTHIQAIMPESHYRFWRSLNGKNS